MQNNTSGNQPVTPDGEGNAKYYLRVEGTNLDSFIFDTEDLSAVRGGSLLLLQAVEELKNKVPGLEPIATGASIGLFRIVTDDAKKIKTDVEKHLNENYPHATFSVDIISSPSADGKKYDVIAQKLLSLNRWRQMRSPSFAIPSQSSGNGACEIDRVRPALNDDAKGSDKVKVSDSVFERRTYGKKQKQEFYKKETGLTELPGFVNDFDELTGDQSGNGEKGYLNHKMAVIYIDGNGFGRIKEGFTEDSQEKQFSDDLKDNRKKVLTNILLHAKGDNDNWIYNGKIRMETLIWGGDDVLWVVPAWVGWCTLAKYYAESARWEFDGKTLFQGGGIVFCHHNAPIRRVKRLAHELAEFAKEKDRGKNLFAYQTLESFDHAGVDIESFRESRLLKGMDKNDLILDGGAMPGFSKAMKTIKKEYPKRKLFKIVHTFKTYPSAARKIATEVEKDLSEEAKEELNNIFMRLDTGKNCPAGWFHMLELWDYTGLES